MSQIPKYVRVLRKVLSHKAADSYIDVFNNGGCAVEARCLGLDKKLVKSVLFVTSNSNVSGQVGKLKFKQSSGNWIYCGDGFYVRHVNDEYHFGRFLAYDTISKSDVGFWHDLSPYDPEHRDSMIFELSVNGSELNFKDIV
jgi:hypothetical protein